MGSKKRDGNSSQVGVAVIWGMGVMAWTEVTAAGTVKATHTMGSGECGD